MLSYIKKYPISLFIILTVIYLSFFKPPKTDLSEIPNLDKLVHICMYFGMSGMLWLEFLRAHRRDEAPLWHAWVGAFFCPVLFSGCVELLQEYCTSYRGGDWLDFAANSTGALLASLVAYYDLLYICIRLERVTDRCKLLSDQPYFFKVALFYVINNLLMFVQTFGAQFAHVPQYKHFVRNCHIPKVLQGSRHTGRIGIVCINDKGIVCCLFKL